MFFSEPLVFHECLTDMSTDNSSKTHREDVNEPANKKRRVATGPSRTPVSDSEEEEDSDDDIDEDDEDDEDDDGSPQDPPRVGTFRDALHAANLPWSHLIDGAKLPQQPDEDFIEDDHQQINILSGQVNNLMGFVAYAANAMFFPVMATRTRQSSSVKVRKSWRVYREEKIKDNTWWQAFRMSPPDFDRLLSWLRPALERDYKQGLRSTPNGALIPEQQLAMAIQFMAGCTVGSILDIFACSIAVVYATVWRVIDAINECSQLGYTFDISIEV